MENLEQEQMEQKVTELIKNYECYINLQELTDNEKIVFRDAYIRGYDDGLKEK